MKKKPDSNSFLYFFGSVALIFTAVVTTALLNRIRSPAPSQDVRARASVTSLMRLTAVVTSVDEAKGIIVVNGLQFSGSAPESLQSLARNIAGEWQVSALSTNLSTLTPGSRVQLQVNPSTFNIADHALSAAAVTVLR